MSTLSLRLPVSLHRKLSDLAENEGVSLNQLISSAAAEKVAALMTQEYLLNRASRASRDKFDAVLARVPKVAPVAGDDMTALDKACRLDLQPFHGRIDIARGAARRALHDLPGDRLVLAGVPPVMTR